MKRRALLLLGFGAGVLRIHAQTRNPRSVSVGVSPGPHAEIMAQVQAIAADAGLDLRLVEREAGRDVNADVIAGRLDVACFQDAVAFDAEAKHVRAALVVVAPTVTLPFALYSRRVASPWHLPHGATLAIPREPAAASRALVLLHNYGLIELREGAGLTSTPREVAGNRYAFKLVPMASNQLAGALTTVDAAVIDRPSAMRAGLQPGRDSIGLEDARSPWAGVLTVRSGDRGASWVAPLVAAYHSESVKRFILERYQDSVRRPW